MILFDKIRDFKKNLNLNAVAAFFVVLGFVKPSKVILAESQEE